MHPSLAFVLASGASLAISSPLIPRAVPTFPAGSNWDIVLNRKSLTTDQLKGAKGDVIDIDLLDNYKDGTIKELAKTKKVICYFSAGSREDWREDANDFEPNDYGKNMTWPGENWVNVKSDHIKTIMTKRIEIAASAGCSAIDPDNVDGYDENQDGYGYESSDYAAYVNWLASVAKEKSLAMGLKNAIDIIPSVIDNIQFAVNEQCHEFKEFNECDRYEPLTKKDLAVFNIEYGLDDCSDPTGVNLSTVVKPADQELNTLGGQC